MATAKTLEMDFSTQLGKTHRMRVYEPSDSLTGTEVATAMDNIVAKNIFNTTYGELTGKIEARIIEKTTTDLTLE